jgi:high affinity Mn2+ porin
LGHSCPRNPHLAAAARVPVALSGTQSLSPAANGRETIDATLYAGIRPWPGGEIWINPEVDQRFGLSNTFGVVEFPSTEAY